MTQTVSFSGTLPQIQAQVLEFIGLTAAQYASALASPAEPVPAAPAPTSSSAVSSDLPIPAGAPAGSKWEQLVPGAKSLVGPDGQVIPVVWTEKGAVLGAPAANVDAEASAAGAALQKVVTGS